MNAFPPEWEMQKENTLNLLHMWTEDLGGP